MSTCSLRILEGRVINPGDVMSLEEAQDFGTYRTLDLVIHVLTVAEGDAPRLVLKHAAFNEEGRYLAFEVAVDVDLTTAGSTWFRVEAFTRYVGWFLTGTLTSSAEVTVDVIGRS